LKASTLTLVPYYDGSRDQIPSSFLSIRGAEPGNDHNKTITVLTLIKIAAGVWFTWDFVRYTRSGLLRRHFTVLCGWTLPEWLRALGLTLLNLGVVMSLIVSLWSLNWAVLNFSWLNLFAMTPEEKQGGTNLVASAATLPWFGIAFAVLLGLNIPRLARAEEEMFRRGTQTVPQLLGRSVKFGFIHMIVGVPVCGALGLTISGLFFAWSYLRGGVREATFVHALNNYWVLVVLGAWTVLGR
jgi:hypothetical protein